MHPNRIGRRVLDCTDMYWAADRIGGPVGKTLEVHRNRGPGVFRVRKSGRPPRRAGAPLAHPDTGRPGLLPRRRPQWQAPRWHERVAQGPWPQPEVRGHCGTSLLQLAVNRDGLSAMRRRHDRDSGLVKFRAPTEIRVPLLTADSMARVSSYADIRGVRRAADAVFTEVLVYSRRNREGPPGWAEHPLRSS